MVAAGPEVFWMLGLVLFALAITGMVLFVIALVRWDMNARKYLLLGLFIVPAIPAVAGWVALFLGWVVGRPEQSPLPPPGV